MIYVYLMCKNYLVKTAASFSCSGDGHDIFINEHICMFNLPFNFQGKGVVIIFVSYE